MDYSFPGQPKYEMLLKQLRKMDGKECAETNEKYFSNEIMRNMCYENQPSDHGDGTEVAHKNYSPEKTFDLKKAAFDNCSGKKKVHSLFHKENLASPVFDSLRDSRHFVPPVQQKVERHCELPTKSALQKINPKQIYIKNHQEAAPPFVAATSTSRSHNLFLNCQQVLAIYKRKFTGRENRIKMEEEEVAPRKVAVEESIQLKICNEMSEKNMQRFKTVLRNLYNEFSNLSYQYDNVMQALRERKPVNGHLKKSLKTLDKCLSRKEEEIVVLIGFYRELVVLKDQLRRAERKRMPNEDIQPVLSAGVNTNNLKLSHSTNLKLKFLLHQVKKFQELLNRS